MIEEHRDGTLDSFVAAWVAPLPDPSFHLRVRRAFDLEVFKVPWWRRWNGALAWHAAKSLCGGAAVGVFLLAVIGLAFPQSARFKLPWLLPSLTMDFEESVYADDGTRTVYNFTTVPMGGGKDRVLWNYSPDHPYDGALNRIVTQAFYLLERLTSPFLEHATLASADADPRAAYMKTGCARGNEAKLLDETVLGEEMLLGYSTTVVQWKIQQRHWKVTAWMAPSLGCRGLKNTIEGQRTDGTYRLIFERRVLEVTP